MRKNKYTDDFLYEDLPMIVKNALKKGYDVRERIYVDEKDKKARLATVDHILEKDDIFRKDELCIPEARWYDRGACVRWDFVKEDEIILFFKEEYYGFTHRQIHEDACRFFLIHS